MEKTVTKRQKHAWSFAEGILWSATIDRDGSQGPNWAAVRKIKALVYPSVNLPAKLSADIPIGQPEKKMVEAVRCSRLPKAASVSALSRKPVANP